MPCEVTLRTGLDDRQHPDIEVLDVEVNDDQALARVRTTAGGEAPATDVVLHVKENGDWRVASLSEPGATGPMTAPRANKRRIAASGGGWRTT